MMNDPYWDVVCEHWSDILMWYQLFASKNPVMLYDIQEQRIYAYPYKEFKAEMSQRSQGMLEEQYRDALVSDKMVVFVRDNENEKLISYSVPLTQQDERTDSVEESRPLLRSAGLTPENAKVLERNRRRRKKWRR
jgi:hypothetical protein